MKVLYYDCFSGISGDMNLGAMLDIGVEKSFLISELDKLNLKGWVLDAERDQRHGISGTRVTVRQTRHEHVHRHLSDIKDIILKSELDKNTKELSLKIFMNIATAEAAVHDISLEKVHFHEVGAVDSIVDIVGAAICFNALKVDAVFVSPLELGGGFVRCDHGTLPVPAPATVEIIKGIPVKTGGVNFEATTPTGAAIIAALGTHFGNLPQVRFEKTAYGVGQKEHPDVPNLLRVCLGESAENKEGHEAVLIECNIDDMNPEFYEHVSEKLFSSGASDVFLTSLIMKKGRPGTMLSVICESGKEDIIREVIFNETTSLGVRTFQFMKDTLVRRFGTINTAYGDVKIKRSFLGDKEVSCKPEFDDCRKIAVEKGIPVKEVYNTVLVAINKERVVK